MTVGAFKRKTLHPTKTKIVGLWDGKGRKTHYHRLGENRQFGPVLHLPPPAFRIGWVPMNYPVTLGIGETGPRGNVGRLQSGGRFELAFTLPDGEKITRDERSAKLMRNKWNPTVNMI